MNNNCKPSKKIDFIWRELDGEIAIISSDNKLLHILNGIGARIWALINGENTLGSIEEIIHIEYGKDREVVRKDLIEFIETLNKLNLLEGYYE